MLSLILLGGFRPPLVLNAVALSADGRLWHDRATGERAQPSSRTHREIIAFSSLDRAAAR